MRVRGAGVLLASGLAVATLLTGCQATTTTITVLAAASLRDVFPKLATRFEADHKGVTVSFSFGASGTLAAQVKSGAPADVLATASESTMQAAGDTVGRPSLFASNSLAIAVSRSSAPKVKRLADLADPGVRVALCRPEVPCGATALQMLGRAGLDVTPVTYTADVAAVLTTVVSGEVDAGVVYRTDVRSVGSKVVGVDIPAESNVSTAYPIAVVEASEHPSLASDFVAFVKSGQGRQALAEAGFGSP